MAEVRQEFDKEMYPNGVNHQFLASPVEELAETFGNGKGRFEDPEKRDIAKNKLQVIQLLKEKCGLKPGCAVVDVGAGEQQNMHHILISL